MNTVRMGVITVCAAVGASGYLLLRGAATDEAQPAQATRAQTANFAASNQAVSRSAEHALDARKLSTAKSPAFELDTLEPELLQPSRTLDELLDAVNADIGPEGQQIDREVLAAMLRSDPELAR